MKVPPPSPELIQRHPEATLLEKALIERTLWERLSREEQLQATSRGKWLQSCLGGSVDDFKQRSNLLKRGVKDPQVWASLQAGRMTFRQAASKAVPPAPASVSSEDPTPIEPEADLDVLLARIKGLVPLAEGLVKTHKARPVRSAATPRSSKPREPDLRVPKVATDEFYNVLKTCIWSWLKDHEFLQADYHQLDEAVTQALSEFYETIEFLRRACMRLEGRRPGLPLVAKIRTPSLKKAFKTLRLPFEDPRTPTFDLQKVRRAYRQIAYHYHPDTNNGQDTYREEYQAVNEAIKAIEDAYQSARNNQGMECHG